MVPVTAATATHALVIVFAAPAPGGCKGEREEEEEEEEEEGNADWPGFTGPPVPDAGTGACAGRALAVPDEGQPWSSEAEAEAEVETGGSVGLSGGPMPSVLG